MREAISKVDSDFVLGLRQDRNLIASSLGEVGRLVCNDGVDIILCSSWCKLGFYDADFGWGMPIWVSSIGMCKSVFLNLIYLVDTRSGNGIEAWVTLDEQEMALLEEDPELRAFASMNP
ncbi:hypothetical protein CDL15_Pgr014265 [Punica granatum]|nr:hypothetical protein CDL15_Pgr014265 [Punica granatum]